MKEDTYFKDLLHNIKMELPTYLQYHGYTLSKGDSGHFKCPNGMAHRNDDKTASAYIKPGMNPPYFTCYGCGAHGSILDIANLIEGKALPGDSEFMSDTIPHLCDILNVPFDPSKLTIKNPQSFKAQNALNRITELLMSQTNYELLKSRGITPKYAKKFKISTGGFNKIYSTLKKEFPQEILKNAGIIKGDTEFKATKFGENLFMDDSIVMAISNQYGKICGFVRRDLNFEEKKKREEQFIAKYANSPQNEYYNKSKLLYLLHEALPSAKKLGEIYIVEGYLDAVTMHMMGITNVAALGGTAFTEDHLNILKAHGIEQINLCLDNDDGGRHATMNFVKNKFKETEEILLRIVKMTKEDDDPDSFINENGMQAFLALPKIDYIEWSIHNMKDEKITENIYQKLVAEIAKKIKYHVKFDDYARIICERWKYNFADVRYDLKIASYNLEDNSKEEAMKLKEEFIKETKGITGTELLEKTNDFLTSLENTLVDVPNPRESEEVERNSWDQYQRLFMEEIVDPLKINCFPRMGAEGEIPKTESFIVIPGREHHGKSTFMRQIALDIAFNNDDVIVLYYSLDDSKKLSIPGLIGSIANVKMKSVRNSNSKSVSDDDRKLISGAFDKIKKYSNRFKLRDSSTGNSISYIRREILQIQKQYPDHKINVFIDSMNDLTDYSMKSERRTGAETTTSKLRDIAVRHSCNVWATTHLRKQNGRPTIGDIKETGTIAYLASMVFIVYNELQSDIGSGTMLKYSSPPNASYEFYPYLFIDICKNKLSEMRGEKLLKMHSDNGYCEEMELEEEKALVNSYLYGAVDETEADNKVFGKSKYERKENTDNSIL